MKCEIQSELLHTYVSAVDDASIHQLKDNGQESGVTTHAKKTKTNSVAFVLGEGNPLACN